MSDLLRRLMKGLHEPVYRSRLRELVARITPHLNAGDRVLDVGCGSGALGQALATSERTPKGVSVEGLERVVRGGEPIRVHAYDGISIPFVDGAFDVAILADVIHHDHQPENLLRECARVSRRLLIIKDHQIEGPFAQWRISLLDWAANAPHDVPCTYKYNTPQQWAEVPGALDMKVDVVVPSMRLYPFPWWIIFGGSIQYFSVLRKVIPPRST